MSKLDDEYPISRINVDDEERRVPKGEYRYALNVRNGTPYIKKGGVATNVKGNVIIPTYLCPYNRGAFPDGRNKTIGAYEDTIKDTVVFFNWNSKGKHGIYRWYKGKKDANNPFGIVEQVIQYNFGWKQNERITSINYVVSTSGDLVYWIDSTGLRKINIDRANINDKIKSWNFYYPVTNPFTVASVFQFKLFDVADNLIVDINFNIGTYGTTNEGIEAIAAEINNRYSNFVVAEACTCHLVLTEKRATSFNYQYLGRPQFGLNPFPCIVVPANWYGTSLTDRMFDRVPYPALTAPKMEYGSDSTYTFNNVKNKVFQSCIRYFYKDYEETVLGVASQIAIDNIGCDGTADLQKNYIDIDFNDDSIPVAETLAILKEVNVLVRNCDLGKGVPDSWKKIVGLEPCEFLDYNYTTQKWFCHYKFYNNISGTTIPTEIATRLDSGVPILANAEVFNQNRIVVGGVTKGRNAPDCAEADYKITIEQPTKETYDVVCHVRIFNPLADGNFTASTAQAYYESTVGNINSIGITQRMGGIYRFDPTYDANSGKAYCWGGTGIGSIGEGIQIVGGDNTYEMYLPEGGFVGYLAGTDLYSISEQIQVKKVNGVRSEGIFLPTVSTNGVLDCVNGFGDVQNFVNLTRTDPDSADLYQRITIKNVPPGKYVFRLASHWCSIGDKLGKGAMYDLNNIRLCQQTSTNVFCVNPYVNGSFQGNVRDSEISFEVTNSDLFLGEVFVEDSCYITPVAGLGTTDNKRALFDGYLYDANGSTSASQLQQIGISIEKQFVKLYYKKNNEDAKGVWENYTDHNGHFYIWIDTSPLGPAGSNPSIGYGFEAYAVNKNLSQPKLLFCNEFDLYYQNDAFSVLKGLSTQSFTPRSISAQDFTRDFVSYRQVFVMNNDITLSNKLKTFIKGGVVNSTNRGVRNVLVVYEHTGRYATTAQDGSWSIPIWADSKQAHIINSPTFTNSGQSRFDDSVLFNNYLCPATFSQDKIRVDIGQTNSFLFDTNTAVQVNISPFSPTSVYKLPDVIETLIASSIGKARKRGGTYLDGIRYYDIQGRLCSVVELFQTYIPFETEDLSKYPQVVDSNGLPYPANTYLFGKPVIEWNINFAPPEYAAYYQLVRTKNLYYGRYLQWVANSVQYVSKVATGTSAEVTTSYTAGNAVAVRVNLTNIVNYKGANPTSVVGYTYEAGDRARIIKDRDGNLIQGLYDLEVTPATDATDVYIAIEQLPFEIKSGFYIEIYNPKGVSSLDNQFFYEVGEVYKCTAPNTPNNQHSVTTGTYTNGDTYWRSRRIPVTDDVANFAALYPDFIESASVSDFYYSEAEDIGRLGLIDENFRELYYPSRLMVSDVFQPDTAANGLSSFSPFNTKDLGKQYGDVARLIMVGKILHCVMKNTQVSSYIGVLTLRYSQSQDGIQVTSDDYLGTQEPSLSLLGTEHPASVATVDGYIYGFTSLRKASWRHAKDGMNEISRNTYTDATGSARTRMVNYFKELCVNGVWDAVGAFDRRYKEYILSVWKTKEALGVTRTQISRQDNSRLAIVRFNSIETINAGDDVDVSYVDSLTGETVEATVTVTQVDTIDLPNVPPITNIRFIVPQGTIKDNVKVKYRGEGKTIAWNEEKNGWTTEYSFLPEVYCTLGDELVSFKDGKLWLHDNNPIHNNFYGVQYETVITPIFNDESNNVKVWNALWCMMYQDNNKCNFYSDKVSNNNGQLSRLKAPNFVKKEEFWFTEFKGDLNDTTVNNPIINGRRLRSTALSVELKNNHTGEINMYGWRVNWSNSERTSK